MDKYYDEYWQENRVMTGSPYDIWKKKVLGTLDLRGNRIFDLGCGNGDISQYFSERFEVHGADVSEYALKSATDKGIITKLIDANDPRLPYSENYFDAVICLDLLEHINDPEAITQEIFRILNNDGTFVVCVPNMLNLFNRLYFAGGNFVDVMDVAHRENGLFSEHIKVFSQKKLELLLANSGFKVSARYFYFPDRFTEKKWRLPRLFALGMLYVCRKITA